jgi:hypothetical protein
MKLPTNRILLDFMHVCEPKKTTWRVHFKYGELTFNEKLSSPCASHEQRKGKYGDSPAHFKYLLYTQMSVECQPHTSSHPRLSLRTEY